MTIEHTYRALLRLYPADYKSTFAAEMLDTFLKASGERRPQGRRRFAYFAAAELLGLLTGAAAEWLAKWTIGSSLRSRSLPGPNPNQCCQPGDAIVEANRQIDILIRRMVDAIAHHDFPNARLYSDQERDARNHLLRLQSMRGLH